MKNAFYAQSGGVTSVINSSAYGVLSQIKESAPESKIFASKNGIVGRIALLFRPEPAARAVLPVAENPAAGRRSLPVNQGNPGVEVLR